MSIVMCDDCMKENYKNRSEYYIRLKELEERKERLMCYHKYKEEKDYLIYINRRKSTNSN